MKVKTFLAGLLTAVLVFEMWGGQSVISDTKETATIKKGEIVENTDVSVNSNYYIAPLTDTNYLSVASTNAETEATTPEAVNVISTEADYYIETLEQFLEFQTESQSNTFAGMTVHLAADIELEGDFAGIGSSESPFCGTFDGHGYAVKKLYSTSNGLFNQLGDGATTASVQNLVIAGAKIELNTAAQNIGVLAGIGNGVAVDNITVTSSKICADSTDQTSAMGAIFGLTCGTVTVSNSNVKRLIIKTEGPTDSIGGFVGKVEAAGTTVEQCEITNSYLKDTYATSKKYVSSFGGVIGNAKEEVNVTDTKVAAVHISTTSLARALGGIVGNVEGEHNSTFTKCTIFVTRVNSQKDTQYIGGLAGYLSETAIISDCYVDGFQCAQSITANYVGGLVGYVSYITETPSSIHSCYVKDITLKGKDSLGNIIGFCETEYSDYQSLWFLNSTLTCVSGGVYACAGETKATETTFTNGEAAWSLNTASGTMENSYIWTQGSEKPIFDTDKTEPAVKVSFVQPSGTTYRYTDSTGNVVLPTEVDEDYTWPTNTYFVMDSIVNASYAGVIGTTFPTPMRSKPSEKEYTIKTKAQLSAFRSASTKYDFTGITIHILSDIDWGGSSGGTWSGIGNGSKYPFTGTLDGHGYTIYNLYSTSSGLFKVAGSTDNPVTIKNLTLKNAEISGTSGMALLVSKIKGSPETGENLISNVKIESSKGKFSGSNCGLLVGCGYSDSDTVTISDCTITDSSMNCTASSDTDVKNWGMLIGKDNGSSGTQLKNCTITNSHMELGECNFTDAGLVAGLIASGASIQGCQIKSSSITTGGISSGLGCLIGNVSSGYLTDNMISGGSINTTYNADNTQVSCIGGLAGKFSSARTKMWDCEVTDVTVNSESSAHSIGGMLGSLEEGAAESIIARCSITNFTLNHSYQTNAEYSNYFGGAFGSVMGKAHITDVDVEKATMNVATPMKCMGGWIGYLSGSYPSVLTDCAVNYTTITQTVNQENCTSYHIGGFAGCVDTDSKFAGCSVASTDINMQGDVDCFAGLIASTYSKEVIRNPIEAAVTVKNCSVKDCDFMTGHSYSGNEYGGLVGWLSEGGIVQNCYVSGITNTAGKYIGGLIGYVSNAESTKSTNIKSCYVENCKLRATESASGMLGFSDASDSVFENLYYYNCTLTGITDSGVAGIEVDTASWLTNGTLLTNLNKASLGTQKNWVQGSAAPTLNPKCNGTTEVKLLCYNIFYMIQNDTYPIKNRRDKVVEYMKKYVEQGVGVMALQEVKADVWYSHIKDFVDSTGWKWSGHGRYGGTFEGYALGATEAGDSFNLIVYDPNQYDKVDEGYFWLSDTPGMKSAFYTCASNYRVANWIRLRDKTTGEEFIFADVHLEETQSSAVTNQWGYTIDSTSGAECRTKQAQLIVDQLAAKADGIPIIQAGDYNSPPGNDAYNITLENGYQCVRNFAHVADVHGGYNAWIREIDKFAKGDHVFTSPLCTSDMYDVRAEDDVDIDTGYRISDHCAIYTTIQY